MSLMLKSTVSFPASAVNDDSSGESAWSNPGNVTAQDSSYATASLAPQSGSDETNFLRCTDFTFANPRKALIVGVKTLVVAKTTVGGGETFQDVRLIQGGSIVGTNRAHDSLIGTSESQFEFGGMVDTWGLSLDAAAVGQGAFGVAIQVHSTSGSFPVISIDAVRMQLFYAHSIKQAIHARLVAHALITALVGGRIYHNMAPGNAASPYLVYSKVSSNSEQHQGGASGLAESRFQIDSYSTDADEVDALATAVRMAMDGYRGTTNSTFINKITLDSEIDGIEGPSVGRQNSIARTTQDYMVWHDESIPTT